MRSIVLLILLLTCVVLGSASLAGAATLTQGAGDGGQIFQQKCAACHTIGKGKLVGPDLKDVTTRRDQAWLKSFISAPDKMLASGDQVAKQLLAENNNVAMPNLGLAPGEVQSLLAYLENPQAGSAPTAAQPVLPEGSPMLGQALFTGQARLTGRGTPCIACHSVAGVGMLGGGSLGPDLTKVYSRYGGQTGLANALGALPFPTMQGVFLNRPLTLQEQADLLAFFAKTDIQSPWPSAAPPVLIWEASAVGAVLLFGMMGIFWFGQRHTTADLLKKKANRRRS